MATRLCQQEDTSNNMPKNTGTDTNIDTSIDTGDQQQAQHVYLAKRAWRRWAKATRAGLPLEHYSQQLCNVLATSAITQDAEHILAYLPTAHELNVLPLLLTWQAQGKQVYITRTWPHSYTLSVHRLEPDALELHRYGYWQPRAHARSIDPRCLQLALLPGLCFDLRGQRLGYGAGYFDRLLATCNTTTIGITCQALIIQNVPHSHTDIPMHYLATEQTVLPCT